MLLLKGYELGLPNQGDDDGSSTSDMSAISSASAKTYITEESSLVLECIEQGQKKYEL